MAVCVSVQYETVIWRHKGAPLHAGSSILEEGRFSGLQLRCSLHLSWWASCRLDRNRGGSLLHLQHRKETRHLLQKVEREKSKMAFFMKTNEREQQLPNCALIVFLTRIISIQWNIYISAEMPLGHPAVLKRNICFYVVRNQLELGEHAYYPVLPQHHFIVL